MNGCIEVLNFDSFRLHFYWRLADWTWYVARFDMITLYHRGPFLLTVLR